MRTAPPRAARARLTAGFAARCLFAVVLSGFAPTAARAAWPTDGLVLAPPPGQAVTTRPAIGPDGAGGVFVATGEDDGATRAFRVLHFDALGDVAAGWPAGGVRAGAPPVVTTNPLVLAAGGGAYLVWTEHGATLDAYALRLAADGSVAPGWPARGLAVTTQHLLDDALACDDGAGGLLVAWRGPDTGTRGISYQHLLANGTRAAGFGAAGRSLTVELLGRSDFVRASLVRDPGHGFWLSYTGVGTDSVFAPTQQLVAHVLENGDVDPQVDPGGFALPTVLPLGPLYVAGVARIALAPDGAGGVSAFTRDAAGDLRGFHLLAGAEADRAWPADGLRLGPILGPGHPALGDAPTWPVVTPDGAGGTYVSWCDSADTRFARLTRVRDDGTYAPGWEGGRRTLGSFYIDLLADASGLFASGFFPVDCPHFSCYGPNALCRFDAGGDVAAGWPDPNPWLLTMPGIDLGDTWPEAAARLCTDGAGGAYATWWGDGAQRLQHWPAAGPTLGVAPAPENGLRARFVPGAGVRVAWALPGAGAATLELYDVNGRRVARERLANATGEVTLAGTRALPAGLWFVRLASGPRFAVAKVAVAR